MGEIVTNSTPCIPNAMWSILVRLEMDGVMVELTILMSADVMGGIVTNSTSSIPNAM